MACGCKNKQKAAVAAAKKEPIKTSAPTNNGVSIKRLERQRRIIR